MKLTRPLVPALVLLGACSTATLQPSIDYSMNSVPEEGGIRFTRITNEIDNVAPPPEIVYSEDYGLRYFVVKPFDVSPDGQEIAFLGRKNDKQNVFLRSTQGGVATTQRTFRETTWDPDFSPDGERIAFTDHRNNTFNIYEINAHSGSAIRQLTSTREVSRYPVYSPDGESIVFVQFEQSSATVTGSDGSVTTAPITRYYVWEQELATNSFTQYSEGYAPAFSPDGTKLALSRNSRDHGNAEIWLLDLASGSETVIASSPDRGYSQPSFSPDGSRILFTGVTLQEEGRPNNFDVFVVNTDGGNLTQLTFHPGHDMIPQFAPSGEEIYFLSQRGTSDGDWNIWRMNVR